VLILVRHGRTPANAGRLLQGRLDPDLDDVGRAQAAAIAAAIGPVDVLVSSPLARARQTAAEFDAEPIIDDRWAEIDYGALDGTPLAEVPPETWAQWRADVDFAPAGGESHRAVSERVLPACRELLETARTSRVVVVTHVTPIKTAVGWALGADERAAWRCFLEQASITRIGADPHGPVLRTFNETWHLDGLAR
jgi:alpha-ribazole phosphatase